MKTPAQSSRTPRTLSTTLANAFSSFTIVVLLLFFSIETFSGYKIHQAGVFNKQQHIAQDAAKIVRSFIHENFSRLKTTIWLTDIHAVSAAEQKRILQSLLGLQPAFRHLVLLDARNRISARSSRLSTDALRRFTDRIGDLLPEQDKRPIETISPVYIDPATNEPLAAIAVLVTDVLGDFKGTLIAELNLKFLWDLMDQHKVGETGYMYVSDRKGNLLAFEDTARVLKGENISHVKAVSDFIQHQNTAAVEKAAHYRGLRGATVVGAYIPLRTPDWAVVAEIPWKEAYRESLQNIAAAVSITLALAAAVGIFGMFIARRLSGPIISLTETASRIAEGEMNLQAKTEGPKEVVRMAVAFNRMTAQLRQSLKELKQHLTDLKQTQRALSLSEERLRLALEGTNDGIWDWDLNTNQAYFSPRYYTMLGYEPGEFPSTYESWRRLLHPDDVEQSEKAVQQSIKEHSPFTIEFRFKAKNGDWRWILGRGKVVESDASGKAVRVAGSHTDITERKQAEKALRESAEQYRIMTSTSMDGFVVVDATGRTLDVNDTACRMLGYSRNEMLKMSSSDIDALDTPGDVQERFQKLKAGQTRFETRHRHKNGRFIDVEVSMTLIPSSGNIMAFLRDITERKQAEAKIRESEEKYRILFDNSEALISVYDREGICRLMNQKVAALFGGDPQDFIGKSFRELHSEAGKDYISRIRETIDFGISKEYEDEVKFPQGSRWLLSRSQPIPDAQGVFRTAQIISQDITERKQAEEALRESAEYHRTITSTSMDGFVVTDSSGNFLDVNVAYCYMLGYSRDELLKMTIADVEYIETMEEIHEHIKKITETGSDRFETRHRRKDGRIIDVEVSMTPIQKKDLQLCFVRDITKRKQAEEALQSSQERLSRVIEGSNDGFWDWNVATGEAYFSDRCYTILGYTPGEFPSDSDKWFNLVHPEDISDVNEKLNKHLEGKVNDFNTEHRLRTRNGDYRWILSRGKVVERDAQGMALRMSGAHTDITERKLAEEALQQAISFSDTLIDSMPGILYVLDEQGRFVRWNKRLESITGYTADEISRMTPADLIAPAERDYIVRKIEEAFSGGEAEAEADLTTKDGRNISYYFTGLRIQIEERPHILGVGIDISDRKQAESRSARLQTLLTSVIMQSPVPMILVSRDGTVDLFNEGCRSVLGVLDETWLDTGVNLFSIEPSWKDYDAHGVQIPPEDGLLVKALQGITTRGKEIRTVRKDGTERWSLADAVPVYDKDGGLIAGFLVFPDITDLKRAEEALEKRILSLTQPMESAEEITFEDLFDLTEIQHLQDMYADAFGVALLIMRPDGTPITRPSNFSELCGKIIRKTAKGAENCTRSDALVVRYNSSGPNIQACMGAGLYNAGASITVGGHHVANWLISQVRNEDQREKEIMPYAIEIGADETAFRKAYRKMPVMSQQQFEKIAHVLFELANQISTIVYQNVQQARFIAERDRAQESLRKYERIVSSSQDLMALVNTDYVYEAANESFLKSRNKTRKEVLGHTMAHVMGEDDFRKKIKPQIDRAFAGQTVHHREVFDSPDNDRRTMEATLFPIMDGKGRAAGAVINIRDITETQKLEEQLIQSQKIESIGTLASGIAHEINNPINGIMNYAQMIADRLETGSPAGGFADEIIHETRRIATIVRNLLTFARREKQTHSPAHLSDIVSSVISLVQTVMRRDQIDLKVDISSDLPKLKCRSQEIQQVLMNLMTNARDALNEKYEGYNPEKRLRVAGDLVVKEDRRFVRATVEDTGAGIEPEIVDRIFDPFFTTKPKDVGTGLGLSISYGIIRNHGGELRVESIPGRYTRFYVDLPVDNGWTLS